MSLSKCHIGLSFAIKDVCINSRHHTVCIPAGSVVLTQTHPAAPYVCRTAGNITLRCQYGGVENVLFVLWSIGGQTTTNPSNLNISGHTTLPLTVTYQELVVDSYTNLATGYRCSPFSNGSQLQSNSYTPQNECECHQLQISITQSKIS